MQPRHGICRGPAVVDGRHLVAVLIVGAKDEPRRCVGGLDGDLLRREVPLILQDRQAAQQSSCRRRPSAGRPRCPKRPRRRGETSAARLLGEAKLPVDVAPRRQRHVRGGLPPTSHWSAARIQLLQIAGHFRSTSVRPDRLKPGMSASRSRPRPRATDTWFDATKVRSPSQIPRPAKRETRRKAATSS